MLILRKLKFYMFCWHCKKKIELPNKKVGFRAVCENCGFDLHVCKNCKYFSIGKPNDCSIPNVDFVKDKEKNNFCEDFKAKIELDEEKNSNIEDVNKKLFKDSTSFIKKDFNSLFKDEDF